MATFLLTWNPTFHPEDGADSSIGAAMRRYMEGDPPGEDDWSTGRKRGYDLGDRVFLVALGVPERGIVASGRITDPQVLERPHWDDGGGTAFYIRLEWDAALDLDMSLPVETLARIAPDTHWAPRRGGVLIDEGDADAVEEEWRRHLDSFGFQDVETELVDLPDDFILEVPRAYRDAQRRVRLHQRRFRALLLSHYPQECWFCGTDIAEILEAAHLVPDSVGGAASIENGRLLCANHHRAFDKNLLKWDGDEFYTPDDGLDVPPHP